MCNSNRPFIPAKDYSEFISLLSFTGMNGRLELRIITQPYSEVYWGYFGCLVFGNSLKKHNKISSFSYFVVICFLPLSHIPPCYHANPPDFPRLIGPGGFTCVEHFVRCGIDTRIYIVFIIINTLQYNRLS